MEADFKAREQEMEARCQAEREMMEQEFQQRQETKHLRLEHAL